MSAEKPKLTREKSFTSRNHEEIESIKIIHEPLIQDIFRYRDLPFKVITFTSTFYLAFIGLFILDKFPALPMKFKVLASLLSFALWLWSVYFISNLNLLYIKASNIRCDIQKWLNLHNMHLQVEEDEKDEEDEDLRPIFPDIFFTGRTASRWTAFWGWGYFAFYISTLFAISVAIIWKAEIFAL